MNRRQSFALVAVVFALLCAPLVLSSGKSNYSADEERYHLPAVRQIRAHWPALDLVNDSWSAVSPAYHYVLATVSHVTGPSVTALRLMNWAVSLGCLAMLWRLLAPLNAPLAAAAVLPLACSNFFVKSSCWVVTDNAGLLAVSALLAWSVRATEARQLWVGGVGAAVATAVRQLHFWTVVPALLAVRERHHDQGRLRQFFGYAALLLPVAVLGLLVAAWGALVPPRWQPDVAHAAGSSAFAGPAYLLAVAALLSPAYLLTLRAPAAFAARRWLVGGAAVGAAVWLAGPTDFDATAGRWGGYLWTLAAHAPAPAQRSLVFGLLTPAGGALLGLLLGRLKATGDRAAFRWWAASLGAWMATTLPSRLAYHRYFEPMLFVFLIIWLLLLLRAVPSARADRRGLGWLAAAQLLLTLLTAHRAVWFVATA